MRKLLPAFALLAALPAHAQRAAPTTAYGAVSGTITCVDTNLPARLISVTLQPIREPSVEPAKSGPDAKPDKDPLQTLSIHQSHLDGSFFIPRVAPGRYYVIAQKPGYLSPVAQYSREEVEHPTPEMRKLLQETVPNVTVSANQTVAIDIRLNRAASISGTIRFDDGTPAPDLSVRFQRKDKDRKWVDTNIGGRVSSDDLGHYHAAGLPAADYRLSTSLSIDETFADHVFGGAGMMSMNTKESIEVYFGDTFFERDAKPLKIEDGENVTADFTIPVSKLHTLTGTLVDARTGHVINAGTITFSTVAADGEESQQIISAKVDEDEPTFHVDFIPEGNYTVRVKDARDVTREEIPWPPGAFLGSRQFKEAVLKRYGPYESPYTVQDDAVGVTLPMAAVKPGVPTPAPDAEP